MTSLTPAEIETLRLIWIVRIATDDALGTISDAQRFELIHLLTQS